MQQIQEKVLQHHMVNEQEVKPQQPQMQNQPQQGATSTGSDPMAKLEPVLKKEVGEIYRFGGQGGSQELQIGDKDVLGYMYTMPGRRAFRFNFLDNKLMSIDIWRKFWVGKDPDETIKMAGKNFATTFHQIVQHLKSGGLPKDDKSESSDSNDDGDKKSVKRFIKKDKDKKKKKSLKEDFLSEADNKRSFPNAKAASAAAAYRAHQTKEPVLVVQNSSGFFNTLRKSIFGKLSKDTQSNYRVVGSVDPKTLVAQKHQQDQNKQQQPTQKPQSSTQVSYSSQSQTSKPPEQDDHKKPAPAQSQAGPAGQHDNDPHKVELVKHHQDAHVAQKIQHKPHKGFDQVEKQYHEGNGKPTSKRDTEKLFNNLKRLTKLVINGHQNALFVHGGPGIGKTHTVTSEFNEAGLRKGKDYHVAKGTVTPAALYQLLYAKRNGGIVMLDDADGAFDSPDATNILKAALDNKKEREITWESTRTVPMHQMDPTTRREFEAKLDHQLKTDPENKKVKFPSSFTYKGRIIFVSNLDRNKVDSAILSRSTPMDMSLTTDEKIDRIKGLLPHIRPDMDMKVKQEVYDYFANELAKSDPERIDIRRFEIALGQMDGLAKSGDPDWKSLIIPDKV